MPALAPLAAGAVAFAAYLLEMLRRAAALQLPAYDTAFFEQVVWNLGHGGGWTSGYFPADFLGLHFEPLLLLPALLERIGAPWQVLLVLSSLGLAASAPAGYLFVRALLGDRRHAAAVAAALATPLPFWLLLQNAALGAFHPEVGALPLVLAAGWLGLRGRWWPCWTALLIALTAKEDLAYATLVIGLVLFRWGPSRTRAAIIVLGSVAWGAAVELWWMPRLLRGTPSDVASYYAWLDHPSTATALQHLAQPQAWLALCMAVAGLAALPLVRPAWLLLAAPPFLGNLLSDHWPQPALQYQYGLPLVLPLLVAAALGAARLLDIERPWGRRLSAPLLVTLCTLSLLIGLWLGPAVPVIGQALKASPSVQSELDTCVAVMPPSAPVAADDDLAVWLAARPREAPLTLRRSDDWLIVDTRETPPGYVNAAARTRILRRLPHSGRHLACSTGRFQVWTPLP